jgi:hypothetical protein
MSDHPNPEQLTHAVRPAGRAKKTVRPVQREIDALPLGSGDWSVAGIPGLVVRCGRRSKSFRLQRRVRGKVVWRVLGQITVAEARRAAMSEWVRLKPRPPQTRITLAEAWQRCLSEKRLSEKSRFLFQYNLDRYLADWKNRTLEEIGRRSARRAGVFPEPGRQLRRSPGAPSDAPTARGLPLTPESCARLARMPHRGGGTAAGYGPGLGFER